MRLGTGVNAPDEGIECAPDAQCVLCGFPVHDGGARVAAALGFEVIHVLCEMRQTALHLRRVHLRQARRAGLS